MKAILAAWALADDLPQTAWDAQTGSSFDLGLLLLSLGLVAGTTLALWRGWI